MKKEENKAEDEFNVLRMLRNTMSEFISALLISINESLRMQLVDLLID